jgi:hypothetical protein
MKRACYRALAPLRRFTAVLGATLLASLGATALAVGGAVAFSGPAGAITTCPGTLVNLVTPPPSGGNPIGTACVTTVASTAGNDTVTFVVTVGPPSTATVTEVYVCYTSLTGGSYTPVTSPGNCAGSGATLSEFKSPDGGEFVFTPSPPANTVTFTETIPSGDTVALHVTCSGCTNGDTGINAGFSLPPPPLGVPLADPVVVGAVLGAAAAAGLLFLGVTRRRHRLARAA